jgi:two-component system sensor histidine kinase UhpB
MGQDIGEETDAAMALAAVMARLGQLGDEADDARALEGLRAVQATHPLRHLALQVHGPDGALLLGPPPAAPAPVPLRWLLVLHRDWLPVTDGRAVQWPVLRPGGQRWTVSLAATRESERREAMASLLGMLALLLAGVVGLLVVMHRNVRHALAPLGRLVQAITGIEGGDRQPVQALPAMPTRELESLAAALRHLGAALDAAEAQRRQLAQQVQTLQDDERALLARDLHDEFGQRLTALRVDAAWLSRRLGGDDALQPVADGMAQQCALVQQDIRQLLTRLQPFGPALPGAGDAEPLDRGCALLLALTAPWQGGDRGFRARLDLAWTDAAGRPQPWPDAASARSLCLPRALWLTLYRISQEALTNVARHAGASQAVLQITCRGDASPGAPVAIGWSVSDDGAGPGPSPGAALQGNGIAGIRQRVWAHGADLQLGPAAPGAARPGWRLAADFSAHWLPAPPAGDAPPAPGDR